jgi:acetyl esterase/lipase
MRLIAMGLLGLLVVAGFPATSMAQRVTPGDILQEVVAEADHRFSYGPDALQFGELRLPSPKDATGPYPVVMLIHGGCWASQLGRLDPRATSLDLLRPMAAALTNFGIATWNVEYRRVGNAGGGWPGTFRDVGQAADALREVAAKYRLDLGRVIVAGHSSGGHLAMWIAARHKLPASSDLHMTNPLSVRGVVNIDGPADPATFQAIETKVCPTPAISDLLGGTPAEQPERYGHASPLTFLPLGIPQEFIAGSLIHSHLDHVTAYQLAARAKGDTVTLTSLPGAGHFDMLSPQSKHWKVLEDRLIALLRSLD